MSGVSDVAGNTCVALSAGQHAVVAPGGGGGGGVGGRRRGRRAALRQGKQEEAGEAQRRHGRALCARQQGIGSGGQQTRESRLAPGVCARSLTVNLTSPHLFDEALLWVARRSTLFLSYSCDPPGYVRQ